MPAHVRITPGVSSGVAPIFVDCSGQNRILVVKGANDCLLPADIDAAADLLRTADCIVLQLEIPLETVYYTLRFARRHGIRAILNPAPGQPLDLAELAHADYVIPNETEAEALSGMPVTSLHEARACAMHLLKSGMPPRHHHAGRQRRAVRQHRKRRHMRALPGGCHRHHRRGRCLHRQFCRFPGGRPHRSGSHRARQRVRGALHAGVGTQMSFVTRERFETTWTGVTAAR